MLARTIFSTCSVGILLLVLIFSCMDFRYSMMTSPCSVIFACWLPMEGQVVAMVARPAPATALALHWVEVYFGFKDAIKRLFELLGGF